MREGTPAPVRLEAYRPPDFLVPAVRLTIDLHPERTRVHAALDLRRNPAGARDADLVLDGGPGVRLLSLKVAGMALRPSEYRREAERLVIPGVPGEVTLETEVEIDPSTNTALEGLYLSNSRYCTQCEAEGFRHITFFPDRPDVLARFDVTIRAERAACPTLLAGGNPASAGELPDGRHYARFVDPFPKPAYLFALVAGEFATLEDRHVTASGRAVRLAIHTEPRYAGQCGHAMYALKAAMAWDERVFGLEYDLDAYHIVAVGDFNMGAMENKGLNIFNARYVLADSATATDQDRRGIESVVAHEYFHNWTGNRVTLRDWFQLSLKEGLTVFRDQLFCADIGSAAVRRIGEVRGVRTAQFAEDASPLAHPVRPRQYLEINNFYTATVYQKGAEVVRMLWKLLGPEGFRRGMDRYFARHDGQAVTIEDFLAAHAAANGVDLRHFARWYDQSGTPVVRAEHHYDALARRYTLTLRQHTPPTPDQPDKQPLLIPVAMGLVGPAGEHYALRLAGEDAPGGTTRVLRLEAAEQTFVFEEVPAAPVASLLRDFSAPVRLQAEHTPAELAHLAVHDEDAWCRYDAVQQLYLAVLKPACNGAPLEVPDALSMLFEKLLGDGDADPALIAEMLALPSEVYLAGEIEPVDPQAIHEARTGLRRALAQRHADALAARYDALAPVGTYRYDAPEAARRALRAACLAYLGDLPGGGARAYAAYRDADNMTDRMAALGVLAHLDAPEREAALADFATRHGDDPLVLDKWFALQAASIRADTLARVRALREHPAYARRNPNRVRALIGSFCHANPLRFHAPDGSGYALLEEELATLDAANPQLAARLATALVNWRRYEPARAAAQRAVLGRLAARAEISKDLYEVAFRALA
jgi:aminopeptidase N